MERLPLLELLFHVQIQESASMWTTKRAFLFHPKFAEFYYHKIFEIRSWWQLKPLRGWMKPLWPLNWRYKDLSMSRDQKVTKLLSPTENCFLLPKFDKSSPSVTRDKEICQSHLMTWSTQWNPLNEVYLLSKFDVFSFSMTGDI